MNIKGMRIRTKSKILIRIEQTRKVLASNANQTIQYLLPLSFCFILRWIYFGINLTFNNDCECLHFTESTIKS